MTPFEAYVMYLACKMHFNQKGYDYIKYNGKVKANPLSFDTRKDKYYFYKLSKKDDLLNYYVANMLENTNVWAGDLLADKGQNIYADWLKRQQSLTYNFTVETRDLYPDFDQYILVEDGQHPPLFKMYRQNSISLETLIILDEIYNIFEYWTSKIEDPVLLPKVIVLCKKYKAFIDYDIVKYKNILKKHIADAK